MLKLELLFIVIIFISKTIIIMLLLLLFGVGEPSCVQHLRDMFLTSTDINNFFLQIIIRSSSDLCMLLCSVILHGQNGGGLIANLGVFDDDYVLKAWRSSMVLELVWWFLFSWKTWWWWWSSRKKRSHQHRIIGLWLSSPYYWS